MIKKIYTILFLIPFLITSQEKLGQFENTIKENNANVLESFSIFNNETNKIATFLIEKKEMYGFIVNENFNVEKHILLENKKRKYKLLMGKMYNDKNQYKVIVSNRIKTKFAIITFDFSTGKANLIEDDFNTRKFLFLQSISRKNKVHLLFIDRNTNNIISRNYYADGHIDDTEFNFKNEEFLITDTKKINLKKLLPDYSNPAHREIKNIAYELTKVSEESHKTNLEADFFSTSVKRKQTSPISIDISSKLSKLYIRNEDVIITLDKNKFYTQILFLNLNNGTYKFKKVKKPLFEAEKLYKKSNSFILDDMLFTTTSTKQKLVININNLENNSLVKQLTIDREQPIEFSNTPIIQTGGDFANYRELEKTKQFLRKITTSNIGISALKNETGIEITLGGRKYVDRPGVTAGIIGGGLFGVLGSFSATSSYFNANTYSYNSYLKKKSVYIKCLFDDNFNHIDGEIRDNVYDKIHTFTNPKKKKLDDDIYTEKEQNSTKKDAVNIFRVNNQLILGYYNKKIKTYNYYKF